MRIHILSDLHIEHRGHLGALIDIDAVNSDLVVLAGDIHSGTHAVAWASKKLSTPVFYVPGNHEYYGYHMPSVDSALQAQSSPDFFVGSPAAGSMRLSDGHGGVRIAGATLWTDFDVFGPEKATMAALATQSALADYYYIAMEEEAIPLIAQGERTNEGKLIKVVGSLTWQETKAIHEAHLAFLKSEAEQARLHGERFVVVSHHAPSIKSSHPKYVNDIVSAGFCSNLEHFAAEHVDLWIHGHMHNSSDYQLGRCRVVANPMGYRHGLSCENPDFDPHLVVTI